MMSIAHTGDPRKFVEGIINQCIRLAVKEGYMTEGFCLDKVAMEDLISRLLENMKTGMHVSELVNSIFAYTKGYFMGMQVNKEK